MGRLKWYKRDVNAALGGMKKLNLEQRGAYNTILDLIYDKEGQLEDDDRFIAGWLSCDVRKWRRIKTELIALGKLTIEPVSNIRYIRNNRADVEVLRALSLLDVAVRAGHASADKRASELNKTKGLGSTGAPTGVSTILESTSTLRKKEEAREGEYLWIGRSGRRLTATDYGHWLQRFRYLSREDFRAELDKADAFCEGNPDRFTKTNGHKPESWFFFFERWLVQADSTARRKGARRQMRNPTISSEATT